MQSFANLSPKCILVHGLFLSDHNIQQKRHGPAPFQCDMQSWSNKKCVSDAGQVILSSAGVDVSRREASVFALGLEDWLLDETLLLVQHSPLPNATKT